MGIPTHYGKRTRRINRFVGRMKRAQYKKMGKGTKTGNEARINTAAGLNLWSLGLSPTM